MEKIELKVDVPVSSPRPRFRNTGKFVQTYMPQSYMAHKENLRWQMPMLMIDKPIKLIIEFYFPLLKSWSKKKRVAMIGQYKRTKPDIDNLIKTVLDAANGHLWKDDNQIVEIQSFKKYADEPKIVIYLDIEGD
ncbi:RusA family crossover junction endodeoxyribonuclease [Staphylococcus gallinarum]|uniref:Endonuclease n=2 Tax=Staphylococcus gallinarum TaxID=1293 RepID=A0ABQ0Y057_STAGA|nr:RusA family crossover junction endodeoxyribonuclease [Staphylococcus gallinarum]KIR10654.1 Holliday junction resolvase [Staphylococcus gallinarum]RTX82857.1 RusA family crossover junction endodeoxyribonuclease [Staphylococcus gallinarum]GEQ04541.1 endonuclease [Staphylococcus gallinarum]